MDISFTDRDNINSRSEKWSFINELIGLPEDKAAVIPVDEDKNITLANIRSQIASRIGTGIFRVHKGHDEDGGIVAHVFRRSDSDKQKVTLNEN